MTGAPPASALPPLLAVPPRPQRPLPPLQLLRTAASDTVGIFDEELFDELVVVRRYGIATLAYVSDPAGIRHVLVDRFDDYPRLPLIRRLYEPEMGTGTLATAGPVWWRHRRIAAPTLDRRALAPDAPGLAAAAEAQAEALSGQVGAPMNIEAQVSRIWMDLLNRMVTGGDPRGLPILAWLAKVPRKPKALDLMPMPAWLRDRLSPARQSPERQALRAALRGLVEERMAEGYAGPQDLLWRLARATDRETGERLPLDEVRDEASALMGAGEATIRALTWIWYLLGLHPEVEARVHAELDAVLGEAPIAPDHLRGLVYTRHVLDEVMRLYPPIPIVPRQARRRDTICGRAIPRGTIVIVAPWIVHRHRKLWSEPERFDPDRFTEARSRDRPRFAHIPFSVGPGMCSGSHFASMQMLILVAALARRYRFRLVPDVPVSPFGGISLHPRGGLWVVPDRR